MFHFSQTGDQKWKCCTTNEWVTACACQQWGESVSLSWGLLCTGNKWVSHSMCLAAVRWVCKPFMEYCTLCTGNKWVSHSMCLAAVRWVCKPFMGYCCVLVRTYHMTDSANYIIDLHCRNSELQNCPVGPPSALFVYCSLFVSAMYLSCFTYIFAVKHKVNILAF